jgi:hypothetical protein
MSNVTVMDQTAICDSLDRLCNQSVVNVNVPKFDAFSDVHDFMAEFERATSTLTDQQKLIVIPKAFPATCYRSWYNTELLPLIKGQASWTTVKNKIISRFSSTGVQEKHFARLRELKYDPDGKQSLLSYIEDILYSYERANPGDTTDKVLSYIKMTLSPALKAKLNLYPDFKNAKSVEMLKSAAKDFDIAGDLTPKGNRVAESSQELANLIKELAANIKKENQAIREDNQAIRKEMAAAFQARDQERQRNFAFEGPRPSFNSGVNYRQRSPGRGESYQRGRSPIDDKRGQGYFRANSPGRRDFQHMEDQTRARVYDSRNQRRSPSPANYRPKSPNRYTDRPRADWWLTISH